MTTAQPAYRITLDGVDLTDKIRPRLVSLTLTENREDEVDRLDISISDFDGKLAIPSRGVKISVQIGWVGKPLVDKGTFTVNEVEHDGTPDVLTIGARSASLVDNLRSIEERSYHATTVGSIIKQIAVRNGLKSGVSAALASKAVKHIDQTEESDAAFLRRLGKSFDAVATIKNDTLIFAPAGQGKTVSGKSLTATTITRRDGDRHDFKSADRDAYSGVRAYWYDTNAAKKKDVVAGLSGNCKRLRTTYATEADAIENARAEWERLKRGVSTFSVTLAIGVPALSPETPVTASGWKKEIDQTSWIVNKAIHTISDAGFTTRAEMEVKSADD